MSKRTICENCNGEGYTDMGASACAVCLGAGVTTPEMLAALAQRAAYREALARISEGTTTVFDEGEGHDVLAPLDDEEMGAIAYAVLNDGARS